MKKIYCLTGITILVLSLILISCKKDDNSPCPIEELDWLKANIEYLESNVDWAQYSYFMSATYKGEPVFYYGNCNPAINYVSFVQNCNGDTLGYTYMLNNELTDIKLAWSYKESRCNFQDK